MEVTRTEEMDWLKTRLLVMEVLMVEMMFCATTGASDPLSFLDGFEDATKETLRDVLATTSPPEAERIRTTHAAMIGCIRDAILVRRGLRPASATQKDQ